MSLHKKYLLGKEAREKLLEGAKTVYDLVSPTSGPKGRNISYARPYGIPRIINDGIEIAKEVGSEDDAVNMGIDLIREAAQNTVTEAGDGTTTATILAYHILKAGIGAIDNGANPMVIRNEMMDALASLLKVIPTLSTKVTTQEDLRKVALISSSYDEEIADVVSQTVHEMGEDGIVTVEEANGMSITSEVTKGMQLQKGYIDPMFVTDPMRMTSTIVDPAIIVFEKVVTAEGEIALILNEVAKTKKDIVIFGDIRGDALKVLIVNKYRGILNLLAVNPPGYQEQRLAVLQDIAIVTGATVITSASTSFSFKDTGRASHVSANKSTTTIAKGLGEKAVIDARIKELREKLESDENTAYQKEVFEERLAKLTAGVALIKVGAKSDTLKREKLEKVKDAVGATKAALAEGVVVGGGMAFIKLAEELSKKDMSQGEAILNLALAAPFRKLIQNSGKSTEQAMALEDSLKKRKPNFGYNVNTDKIEDLMVSGVIDPIRVIRLSLENAVVTATSMLTTEGIIWDSVEKKQG